MIKVPNYLMRRILVPFKSLESVWILTRIVPILNESSQSILSWIKEIIEYLASKTIYVFVCYLFLFERSLVELNLLFQGFRNRL